MKKFLVVGVMLFLLSTPFLSYSQGSAKAKITVIDELGNVVEGATVSLYVSEDDYRNSKNASFQGTTNAKGQVKFKKLKPMAYFIDARKDDLKNDGRGAKTESLVKGKMTKLNVVIE